MSIAGLLVAAGNQSDGSFPPATPREGYFLKRTLQKIYFNHAFQSWTVKFQRVQTIYPTLGATLLKQKIRYFS